VTIRPKTPPGGLTVGTPVPAGRRRKHRHHRYVPPPTTAPPPQPVCYPTADSGNCYEPGEFCRDSDHDAYGLAGDGEKIRCEDNNGWRWEGLPAGRGEPMSRQVSG
jgi:hypothetical protein